MMWLDDQFHPGRRQHVPFVIFLSTFVASFLLCTLSARTIGILIWDPIGLATPPASIPLTPERAVEPKFNRLSPVRPSQVASSAAKAVGVVAASASAAWAIQGPVVPTVEQTAWLPPTAVTGFLAALTVVTMVGMTYKIATAAEDEMPFETLRGVSSELKKQKGNINTERPLQDISMRYVLDKEMSIWQIRLQLMKPVTWAPLLVGVVCGTAASGNFHWWNPLTIGQPDHVPFALAASDLAKLLLAMFMSGPLLTGYTQTINDWYDRDIDAINEPYRAIPSGRISGPQVIAQIWVLLLSGVALAAGLDWWAGHWFDGVSGIFLGPVQVPPILANALFGSLVAYIYSAPPLKLKQSGWIGDYACGASYIALPWWCGQSLFGQLNPEVMVLSLLYSIGGLGIAIVNDFKSMEGDRMKGLMSLTVMYGLDRAKWICAATMDLTQLATALYLASVGETNYALVLFGLLVPQITAQFQYLLKDPIKYDVKYQISALPFFSSGLFVTALAMAHHQAMLGL
eukprot:EG_transcript_6198